MNRRRFLTACIATIAAPAIVRAESLMPVRNRTITGLWVGMDWGASYADRTGLVLLQQAQNAMDRAMMDNLYMVVNPALVREFERQLVAPIAVGDYLYSSPPDHARLMPMSRT